MLTLGEIKIEGYSKNIPQIEVIVDDECVGYLSPYKGLYFHVTKTIDANICMGMQPYHGYDLKSYMKYEEHDFPVLQAFAIAAIDAYVDLVVHLFGERTCVFIDKGYDSEFTKFINECIRWIRYDN